MTVFRDVGPYAIQRQIGRGSMGQVFLATDTRSGAAVALKVVHVGSDADAREIVAAEQRGAELQQKFSQLSQYVPQVYEVGLIADYFFIAMEYIDGEDVSAILKRGPFAPERAVAIAIQLCRFLEEVDRVEASAEGQSGWTLLHNDLKPTNIRVATGDHVKVLDFGAAKELTRSKRVTRNDFGSIAYLSPECLETGDRDRQSDAWALGIVLYEMARGRLPFRADDTVKLERLIRSRTPPEPLTSSPAALQAVIAKLLAPYPADRYSDALSIRQDLERIPSGEMTEAEREGWPVRTTDEPATRRTSPPLSDLEGAPTRRTSPGAGASAGVGAVTTEESAGAQDAMAAEAGPAKRSRFVTLLRRGLAGVVLLVLLNEACVTRRADAVAAQVPLQEFSGLNNLWTQYESLDARSYLGFAVRGLEQQLARQTLVLADRVIGNYRSPAPSVREAQWEAAAGALRHALSVAPRNDEMRGALRYCEGHLHRIDGEALKQRGQTAAAQRELSEALTAFREAAALRPKWPDPFLGLARTFIYGMEDIDRGADAIEQARKLGFHTGSRETGQLADGYRMHGEALERAAGQLQGLPQERESLKNALDAFKKALELYSKIPDVGDAPARIRQTQRRIELLEDKLDERGVLPFLRDLMGMTPAALSRTPAVPVHTAPGAMVHSWG